MRLKTIQMTDFKRFSNLTVDGIPEEARLIVLAGPNGSGKSSLFDAFLTWRQSKSHRGMNWDSSYYNKVYHHAPSSEEWNDQVRISFHENDSTIPQDIRMTFYIRSAYRNDPDFQVNRLQRQADLLDEVRIERLIDNDAAIGTNYQRLVSNAVEDAFDKLPGQMALDDFRFQVTSAIAEAIRQLFPNLSFNSLGNPLTDGSFRFTKGESQGFHFKNLSGGEKAVFDLVLDLVVASHSYQDTVYCIDEPESHINPRIHGSLLQVLLDLIPPSCQLMLATHSMGIMRKARDMEGEQPGTVAFLDFGSSDFDQEAHIEPTIPNREFWQRTYEVALGDMASLVAPERVVICEGEPGTRAHAAYDAKCFEAIFREEFPETQFIPGGNADEVLNDKRGLAYAFRMLVDGVEVIRLIDRDDRSGREVSEANDRGVRVLSRRHIESYLLDDEVLLRLAEQVSQSDSAERLLTEKHRVIKENVGKTSDDMKAHAGVIYNVCKKVLNLTGHGNDARVFMRDTLAPLLEPGMATYEQLKSDVFG